MTTIQARPLANINHDALALLCHHLGVAETLRFVNQFAPGYGNYTEDRRELFGAMSVNEIAREIEQMRDSAPETESRPF